MVLVVGGTTVAAAAATPLSSPPVPPTATSGPVLDPGPVLDAGSNRDLLRDGDLAGGGAAGDSGVAGDSDRARPPAGSARAARTDPAPGVRRQPPLRGERARRFEPPPHEYGPGHRGVDLPAVAGVVVLAPADGVVTFAGPVAGRGVVVVEHAGATLTSLEPVGALVPVGARVGVGDPVARVQTDPRHAGCPVPAPGTCLHWGVRVDGRYVDPWWWLGRAGPVRLLPFTEP